MDKFDPSFVVMLLSLAGVMCSKKVMEGNLSEVPTFFQSNVGRVINSTLGLFFMGSFAAAFYNGFTQVAWWFPFLILLLASILVNIAPFVRSSSNSKVFAPAIGIVVYTLLTLISVMWLIVRW